MTVDAKKICWWGWLGQVPQPRLASSNWLGRLPSPVTSLLYKKKTLGTEVRRTPDVKLRFVGVIRFVVVMVRSYSFGHLDSVK